MLAMAIVALFILTGISGCGNAEGTERRSAEGGVLDLRQWNFDRWGLAPLSGEWTFYPNKLLKPSSSDNGGIAVYVPNSWNNYDRKLGYANGTGYGTYRLTVLLDGDEPTMSVRIPNLYTSYRLWVNGKFAAARGVVSTSSDEAEPMQSPQIATFRSDGGRAELLLQISNFHHRRGGVWEVLELGRTSDVIERQTRATAQTMVLFGALAVVGMYHIALFVLRREETFTLHFGLLCLWVGIRTIVTGEVLLLRWIPGFSWEVGLKIDYMSLALSALAGYLYVFELFPKDASNRVRYAIGISTAVMCVFVLLFPAYRYTQLLGFFQLFIVTVSLYAVYVLIVAKLRKREGASFVLMGIFVFVLTILNDMIYYNQWYRTTELVPIGLFFFILMQAVIISTRFSGALRKVETVSEALKELNVHLEDRIEERTVALRSSNEKLEASNVELEKMERSRRHLLTNISHDLRTPMTLVQGYLEAMQDGVVKGEEQQAKYVRMVLGKIDGLNRLIAELFELSKLESGQVRLELREIVVAEWAESLREYFGLDIESRGMTMGIEVAEEHAGAPGGERIRVRIDETRMNKALANLVYNAIKHMPTGGRLELRFRLDRKADKLLLEVSDTGSGIEEEDMPYIFDRFYKKDKSRNSAGGGSGIGLAIVKEIIELHGGVIVAESQPGEGTTFRIALPSSLIEARPGG
ncbi:sensor histidine kinase [Paenibacillus darwinianus]|nr:ATP-binding protein [Paenibacillus darwinianus]